MKHFDKNIFEITRKKPLILDGAIGSLLQMRGIKSKGSIWTAYANMDHPEMVTAIHKEYIEAGADIITTNTFRTNPAALGISKGMDETQLQLYVRTAVQLAISSKSNQNIIIAGSNAPAEDCYQAKRTLSPEYLEYNHSRHIELLYSYGCDIILNETQSHLDEIRLISRFCEKNSIPFIMSFYFTPQLKLLSGEEVTAAIETALGHGALAIGFNCIFADDVSKLLEKIKPSFNWGYYLNTGEKSRDARQIKCHIDENEYLETAKKLDKYTPSFIGACCGSEPKHIQQLNKYYNGLS